MALIGDFLKAIAQLSDGRFLLVFLKALGLTLALFVGVAMIAAWLVGFIPTDLGEWWLIGQVTLPLAGLQGLAFGAVILASPFLMIPVAALFVGLFLDDIAAAVEARHYPGLGDARSAGVAEAIGAALRFTGVVIAANLVALIPYLILLIVFAPFAWLAALALNGYLLGREYFETAAARHLPAREAEGLRRRHWARTWLAGLCMAAPLSIPIMNLLVPVLGVATITHQVQRLRGRNDA